MLYFGEKSLEKMIFRSASRREAQPRKVQHAGASLRRSFVLQLCILRQQYLWPLQALGPTYGTVL